MARVYIGGTKVNLDSRALAARLRCECEIDHEHHPGPCANHGTERKAQLLVLAVEGLGTYFDDDRVPLPAVELAGDLRDALRAAHEAGS